MDIFDIDEELKKVPQLPGVYLMHDKKGEIIYVGKAKVLSHRLHQYFQDSHSEGIKKDIMVSNIAWFEYVVTDTEVEALILECNLIKEHKPKYNTLLTDDKTYPYIKVTLQEKFPRVVFSRELKADGSAYFGPYASAGAVKDVISLINKAYRLRTCVHMNGRERACLNYHIDQCAAPCMGYEDAEGYGKKIKKAIEFLNGKYDELIDDLKNRMEKASEELRFEEAAVIRDMYKSVLNLGEKQKVSKYERSDRDIVAVARDGNDAMVCIFFIRQGRMNGKDDFLIKASECEEDSVVISSFIKQFYSGTPQVPSEIWLQMEIEDSEIIENYLSEKKGGAVHIHVPKRGEKNRMVELAYKNALMRLTKDRERMKREEERTLGAVHEIEELLCEEDLYRMEAYDISNISGVYPVGSMVVYEGGKPKKTDYRRFSIKTVKGPDDYASMKEVLTRRFTHVGGGFERYPDIIMMDGGKGQVNVCLEVLEELGIDIPVCGMVKDDRHRTRGIYYKNEEIPIDIHSNAFALVTRIQDEAHRFAIEYHKSLRSKGQVHSILDDIEGVGDKRRKSLMLYFESLESIKEASIEELAKAPSMNIASAKAVWEFFHVDNTEQTVDKASNPN